MRGFPENEVVPTSSHYLYDCRWFFLCVGLNISFPYLGVK